VSIRLVWAVRILKPELAPRHRCQFTRDRRRRRGALSPNVVGSVTSRPPLASRPAWGAGSHGLASKATDFDWVT